MLTSKGYQKSKKLMQGKLLKAHQQISTKRCFEKYCSCDQAYQVSALQDTPWRSYLENLKIDDKFDDKFINKFDFL